MAANFWVSSHCNHWLVDRHTIQAADAVNYSLLSPTDLQRYKLFCIRLIQLIGAARTFQIRQQVIATSIVYFKRFYLRNSMLDCDPLLVAPTCVYLACKVEECAQVARTIVDKTRAAIADTPLKDTPYPYADRDILECELFLLEDMECYLIVYHPYRPLAQYLHDLKLQPLLQSAWSVVNDALRSDACLLYPPFLISLAAIYIAVSMSSDRAEEQDQLAAWYAELNVDATEILEVTQEILSAYSKILELEPDTSPAVAEISKRITARVMQPPSAVIAAQGQPAASSSSLSAGAAVVPSAPGTSLLNAIPL